ncbi:hypothetical protein [Streptomyces sp. NPDC054784]
MHQLIRVPALKNSNELFGAAVAAAYLTVSGAVVTVGPKEAADLAERVKQGLDVRQVADEIRGWTARPTRN